MYNAPSPHLVVSPSYKMAKRTTVPMIESLLLGKKSLHPDLWFRYHKTDHEFKIKWRGREGKIWIASGDDPQSLKGPDVPPSVHLNSKVKRAGTFRVVAINPYSPLGDVDDWVGCDALLPEQVKMGFYSDKISILSVDFLLELAVSTTKSIINGFISPIGAKTSHNEWHDTIFGVMNLNFGGQLSSNIPFLGGVSEGHNRSIN